MITSYKPRPHLFISRLLKKILKELFDLRKKFKDEGNPIQEVYKVLMSSAYGFTIMKAPEYVIKIKSGEA